MPEVQAPPPLPKSQPWFGKRHSTILKLLGVGALVLVLLIPLMMITGVLNERLQRRNEAVADITSSWGKEQNVIGPVLGIPYQYKFKTVKEIPAPDGKVERREVEETATANAYFLARKHLNLSGTVQTQKLHRGIYEAVVYRAQTVLSGKFAPPDFGPLKIELKDVQWKDAFITIAVNDLRGTREGIVLDWGGTKRPMLPGSQVPGYTTGATASLGGDQPISNRSSIFDPAGFQWQRGNFLRAIRSAKRSDAEIELARPWISRRVSSRGTIGSAGWFRREMESFVLRPGLSAIVDEPDWQRAFHDAGGFKLAFRHAISVDSGCVSLRRAFD